MDRIPVVCHHSLADLFYVLLVVSLPRFFSSFRFILSFSFLFNLVVFSYCRPPVCVRAFVWLFSLVVHHCDLRWPTGSGVNRGNRVKMKTQTPLVSNIYIHNDEPPHFNLRFTAPDYNNNTLHLE